MKKMVMEAVSRCCSSFKSMKVCDSAVLHVGSRNFSFLSNLSFSKFFLFPTLPCIRRISSTILIPFFYLSMMLFILFLSCPPPLPRLQMIRSSSVCCESVAFSTGQLANPAWGRAAICLSLDVPCRCRLWASGLGRRRRRCWGLADEEVIPIFLFWSLVTNWIWSALVRTMDGEHSCSLGQS